MKNYTITGPWFFGIVGAIGVVAGGLLSAFAASNPTEFIAWASAYLVLVVGVLQVGLALSINYAIKQTSSRITVASFTLFNLGSLCVILGTYLKGDHSGSLLLVNTGGLLLAISMILILHIARREKYSRALAMLYVIAGIVLVSMPIGLFLAQR